jgi:hypothetical protein
LVAGRWSLVSRAESEVGSHFGRWSLVRNPVSGSRRSGSNIGDRCRVAGSGASCIGRMNPPLLHAADADGGVGGTPPGRREHPRRHAWSPTRRRANSFAQYTISVGMSTAIGRERRAQSEVGAGPPPGRGSRRVLDWALRMAGSSSAPRRGRRPFVGANSFAQYTISVGMSTAIGRWRPETRDPGTRNMVFTFG